MQKSATQYELEGKGEGGGAFKRMFHLFEEETKEQFKKVGNLLYLYLAYLGALSALTELRIQLQFS